MKNQHSLAWRSQCQGQCGVISRQQAFEVGFTAKAIEWRLRSGAWQRLQPGIYATFTGELSREARLWAAILRTGPGAVLSYESAAEIHGLIDKPVKQIHISVPAERRPGQCTKDPGCDDPPGTAAGAAVAAAVAAATDDRGGYGP
jgi:hypothetical protein